MTEAAPAASTALKRTSVPVSGATAASALPVIEVDGS